ncbi:hypothetical protein FE257_003846 [Aspergillus nanangensis]|uniref:Nudix hydrolase domain-containing protein n=1 Tax=Aspergillus nanangensis TaxID=2582783 RepID=A0AAD4CB52_ASPNN|nr:hypothetical protein FE257_003846 [Aspergillus nanangensis]
MSPLTGPCEGYTEHLFSINNIILTVNVHNTLSEYLNPWTNSTDKAGVMVMSPKEDETLLLERAERDKHPNIIETPAGGQEKKDTSPIATAIRECWEETGLYVTEILRCFIQGWEREGKAVQKITFIGKVYHHTDDKLPEITLRPEEHKTSYWVKKDQLQQIDGTKFWPGAKAQMVKNFDF